MTAGTTRGAGSQLGATQWPSNSDQTFAQGVTGGRGKKNGDDDDDKDDDSNGDSDIDKQGGSATRRGSWQAPFLRLMDTKSPTSFNIFSTLPTFAPLLVRSAAIATVALYVLNQKHMLPMPIGRVVSKALFWPTIPITISRRMGKWTTVVDNAVVIGGAPFGWCGYPERLSKQFNVRGVVNMCDEYRGPVSSYKRLGIEHLRLPTVDHFEPSVEDLKKAVAFIQRHEHNGGRVYVHCRAGHGRSAAAVYAWLLYKEPLADPVELNEKLCSMRDVRKSLWKQPNIIFFREWLRNGGMMSDSDGEDDYPSLRHGNSASKYQTESYTEDSGSDDYEDDIIRTKLGQIFSDEDSVTEYSSEEIYDYKYDEEISEDERDYENWRIYNQGDD
jgi:atypical dual specificity phosphatase